VQRYNKKMRYANKFAKNGKTSEKIRKLEAAHKYAAHRRYYRKEMLVLSERGDLF
jgi:hypothetical protein